MKLLRLPLLLFAVPAMLVALASAHHGALVLDRDALADGELWRLWTGHWVHFSASHLFWNLAVLVAAGTWLERVRPGALIRHAMVVPPLIGLAILAGETGLKTYGGLSALATGTVVLLALHQLDAPRADRRLWAGVLMLVALKCVGDHLHLGPIFARYDESTVRTSTAAHAAGAIAAVLQFAAGVGSLFAATSCARSAQAPTLHRKHLILSPFLPRIPVGSPLAGARRRRAQAR